MTNKNTSEKQINDINNQTFYKRTEYIKINSNRHNQLIERVKVENSLLSKFIEKCDIEVFNDKIIVLRYPTKTIYSEQATLRKQDLIEIFSKITKKEVDVIPFVAVLNQSNT